MEKRKPHNKIVATGLAGALAGIAEHCILFPIDTLKTRTQGIHIKNIKPRGKWTGISAAILGSGPSHTLYFGIYEKSKALADKRDGLWYYPAIGGSLASLASMLFMAPFDVLKQRMQIYGSGATLIKTFKNIYFKEGISSFFISYPTAIALDVPFQSIQFMVYDKMSKLLNIDNEKLSIKTAAVGMTAGFTASTLTTPIDVIKTVLQTRGNATNPSHRTIKGFRESARLIYSLNGINGFFKGIKTRAIIHTASTGICWTIYQTLKTSLPDFFGDIEDLH